MSLIAGCVLALSQFWSARGSLTENVSNAKSQPTRKAKEPARTRHWVKGSLGPVLLVGSSWCGWAPFLEGKLPSARVRCRLVMVLLTLVLSGASVLAGVGPGC